MHGHSPGLRSRRVLVIFVVAVVGIVILLVHGRHPNSYMSEKRTPLDMNSTHIKGLPIEPTAVNITDNIYFTVKTSAMNYKKRLPDVMLTWFQAVNKSKVEYCTMHLIVTL